MVPGDVDEPGDQERAHHHRGVAQVGQHPQEADRGGVRAGGTQVVVIVQGGRGGTVVRRPEQVTRATAKVAQCCGQDQTARGSAATRRRTAGGLVRLQRCATFAVALVTGLLPDMVDHSSGLAALDDDVATWGAAHADAAAVGLLRVLTYLGDTPVVVGALLVAGLVDVARHHRVEALLFLGTVIIGEKLIVNGLKEIVDRTRPDVLPLVGWQGPPSRPATPPRPPPRGPLSRSS